jgi:hypothetical protein
VNGFDDPLPTLRDIQNEIAKQNIAIISGDYEETGLMLGHVATLHNDPKALDPLLEQGATTPPLIIRNRENPKGGVIGQVNDTTRVLTSRPN